jgi:dihydroflavonol-4-reductase
VTDVVVTGASGHVGASLVRQLLARGDRVRVVLEADDPASLRGLPLDRVHGDVRDQAALRRAFDGAEILYHLAAVISIVGGMDGLVRAVNVDGVRNAGRAALEVGVRRMVYMCSVHAFQQEPHDQPLDESRARVDSTGLAYDDSKASGEAVVRKLVEEGLDAVILHPSGCIGPYDFGPSRMGQVWLDLYQRRLRLLIDGGFDWVDTRDVARAAISASEQGRTNESYILSGHYRTIADLSQLASRFTGVAPPRWVAPAWLANAGAPVLEAWAAITKREPLFTRESVAALQCNPRMVRTKAFDELGHNPRPTEESVRDAHAWFAAQGQLPLVREEGTRTHQRVSFT